MKTVAILVSGRGSNLIALHKSILNGSIPNAKIACVIANKECGGIEYATGEGLPTHVLKSKGVPSQEYNNALLELLNGYNPDLICLAGYMKIVGQQIIDKYYGRMLNIHPALLPAFPGLDAQKQAIDYGARVSGCTVHFVDGGMDTGPIILQSVVDIAQEDDAESLSAKILVQEHKIYSEAVRLFVEGQLSLDGRKVRIAQTRHCEEL